MKKIKITEKSPKFSKKKKYFSNLPNSLLQNAKNPKLPNHEIHHDLKNDNFIPI
jgi:hypothetical protein